MSESPKVLLQQDLASLNFLDYPLDYDKAQTSSSVLSMAFLDLTRSQIKVKAQDYFACLE